MRERAFGREKLVEGREIAEQAESGATRGGPARGGVGVSERGEAQRAKLIGGRGGGPSGGGGSEREAVVRDDEQLGGESGEDQQVEVCGIVRGGGQGAAESVARAGSELAEGRAEERRRRGGDEGEAEHVIGDIGAGGHGGSIGADSR